jgi:hypothetical protein
MNLKSTNGICELMYVYYKEKIFKVLKVYSSNENFTIADIKHIDTLIEIKCVSVSDLKVI